MGKGTHNIKKIDKQALLDMIEQAEQAMLAKSQFLSVMSHEMLTPMNAIIGFTNLLLENPRSDQLESLKLIEFSAQNLLVLIEDLLDFHRIEAGRITLEESEVSLNELLNNIIATHQRDANKKDINLTLEVGQGITHKVVADAGRLAQVLNNLISNAIKFTWQGAVTAKVKLVKQYKYSVSVCFEVSDTGIGIPKSKQQLIFETFSQASSDSTRKYGGTGLGLAITNRLLELMGSRIKVKSRLGRGSCFYFTVKFTKSELPGEHVPVFTKAQGWSLKGMKILLVEDNPINIFLAKKFFMKWHIDFTVVENGRDALDMVQQNDYHLVLMDLQMPVMDGYEATKAIRNLPYNKYDQLPIVALTASAELNMEEKIRNVGMNDCIRKPFKPEELYIKISAYFPGNG